MLLDGSTLTIEQLLAIAPETLDALSALINHGVHPRVPSRGSHCC